MIPHELAEGELGHSFAGLAGQDNMSDPQGQLLPPAGHLVFADQDPPEPIWTYAQASARGAIFVVAAGAALWTTYSWYWKIGVFVAVTNGMGLVIIMLEALLHAFSQRQTRL